MNSYSIFLFKDENNCHKEKSLCIGGKTKCVKMNETLNQWKAL